MKHLAIKRFYRRALITWFLFIPIAFLNGALREAFYKPYTGDLLAHQISTLLGSAAFVTLAYLRMRNDVWYQQRNVLFKTGTMWLALTIVFEFVLGIAGGNSLDKILHDYNIFAGRVWIIVLLTIFFTPHLLKLMVRTKHVY